MRTPTASRLRALFPHTPALVALLVAAAWASPTSAQVRAITDITAGIAVRDGTIGATEYAGSTTGVNTGFGGKLGAGTRLHFDSDSAGNLALALEDTTFGGSESCFLGADDSVVLYLDSRAGGLPGTSGLTDTGDGGRAAISGRGTGGGVATLTFASGFTADFAIVLRDDSASLYRLVEGGALEFVKALTRAPGAMFGAACDREIDGFSLADLGAAPGTAIDYVATLINASNAFRSNEFQGVAAGTAPDNIGANPFTFGATDFATFQTYAAPAVIAGQKTLIEFRGFAGAGFSPSPSATQLDSRNWAVTGLSDGDLAFGGTQTAGDFARGSSAAAVSTGGLYNFAVSTGATTLGLQPSGSDLTPGAITLRLQNTTTGRLVSVDLSYTIWVRNDQGYATSLDLAWSANGTTFTPVPSVSYTSGAAADALGFVAVTRRVSLSVAVRAGQFFYLRWSTDDVPGGSGSRDELALDDLVLRSTFDRCGDGTLDSGETCDSGAANGTTTCGCDAACGLPAAGTACGTASGLCDAADACDGAGACIDRLAEAGTPCRATAGDCDIAEACDGVAKTCPVDGFVTAGTACRAANGTCDVAESCTGSAAACPADGFVANGTACADGTACNGAETCVAGACTPGTAVACDDGNVCTADACTEPAGTCENAPIAGCCRTNADCNDGDACTADVCGADNRCTNPSLATTETCNGADDDCDGSVDEDFTDLGDACSAGVGACLASGTRVCATGGAATTCNAVAGTPATETCNAIDDDCDGTIDDAASDAGGACGSDVGACQRGTLVCRSGALACDGQITPVTETCNGTDDDCDGDTDEDFTDLGDACSAGVGACLASGTRVCATDGTATTCNAVAGTPVTETCNAIDDDCDGTVDDAASDAGGACGSDIGACQRGTLVCRSGALACDGQITPVTETCNGADDDCDGRTDEDYADLGDACTAGVGACLARGARVCAADGQGTTCGAAAGTPARETCNAIDDDCDGDTDEDFTDLGDACSAGVGACLRSGTRICAADGSTTSCDAIVGTPARETCNAIDDDCDGDIDEDFTDLGDACSAGVGACLRNGVRVCAADGSATSCDAIAGAAMAELCNASDDDCDGSVDEGGDALCTASAQPFCVRIGAVSFCAECAGDADCAGRTDGRDACIGPDNTCAGCTDSDASRCDPSGRGGLCRSEGVCGCAGDADCAADRFCDLATSVCVARALPDAGMPDAGSDIDAGADIDAGIDSDAGSDIDAGADIDAGSDIDAGGDTDAGIDTDAGGDTDAGIDTDAGTDTDAGGDIDAGIDIDAGMDIDAGADIDASVDAGRSDLGTSDADVDADVPVAPEPANDGGCSCRAAGYGTTSGPGAGLFACVALLALLGRAARRRR